MALPQTDLIATVEQSVELGFQGLTDIHLAIASSAVRRYTLQYVTAKDHEFIASNDWVALRQYPVQSIIGVYEMDGTTVRTYRRNSSTTIQVPGARPVIVRYRAGWEEEEIPLDLIRVTCQMAKRVKDQMDNGGTSESVNWGGLKVGEVTLPSNWEDRRADDGALTPGQKIVLDECFPLSRAGFAVFGGGV